MDIVGGDPNLRHQILGHGNQGMLLGMMGERWVIYISADADQISQLIKATELVFSLNIR